MAARSFTVHSLGAGGRFGRPGKAMAPPARDPNAAPTGGEFVYSAGPSMGDFVRTKGELAQNDASIFYPAENIAKVQLAAQIRQFCLEKRQQCNAIVCFTTFDMSR